MFNYEDTNRRCNQFGFTNETLDILLYPMGAGGKEALGSMGNDAPLAGKLTYDTPSEYLTHSEPTLSTYPTSIPLTQSIHSFIDPLTHPSIHSPIHPSTHPSIHSSTPPIHPLTHPSSSNSHVQQASYGLRLFQTTLSTYPTSTPFNPFIHSHHLLSCNSHVQQASHGLRLFQTAFRPSHKPSHRSYPRGTPPPPCITIS